MGVGEIKPLEYTPPVKLKKKGELNNSTIKPFECVNKVLYNTCDIHY